MQGRGHFRNVLVKICKSRTSRLITNGFQAHTCPRYVKVMNGWRSNLQPGVSKYPIISSEKALRKGLLDQSAGNYALSGTMINGNIESYAVREPYITGWASTRCLDPTVEAACEGYFLLNSQTHEVFVGMSAEEWKIELEHIGWSNPTLRQLRKT